MKNSTRGLVAGGLGVALLAGGTTFALWTDSADVDGGVITAGNLQLELAENQWYDVSADRTDSPHEIDLGDFLIVPGDTIRGDYDIDAALAGDNIVAQLSIQQGTASGDLLGDAHGVTVTYRVVDADGDEVLPSTSISTASELELYASTDNENTGDPALPTLPGELGGDSELTVEITAVFDPSTPDQVRTNASAALADMTVDLKQVRSGAPGYEG